MAKIEIELVAEVLLEQKKLEQPDIEMIVRQLVRAAERAADEAAAEKEPAVKKQMVILVSDPRGEIPDEDFVGWVLQIPENDSPATALDRLIKSAHTYNATRRGHKYPAKSIGEVCEVVGGKFLKENNVSVKTRLPITILKTDNDLPSDLAGSITIEELRSRG